MTSTKHQQLLSRFIDAAQTLTQTSDDGLDDVSKDTTTCLEEGPTKRLLSRQACQLIRLRDDMLCGTTSVDQDLIKRRIKDVVSLSSAKFYAYRYDLLPAVWRQIYTDALILETLMLLLRALVSEDTLPGNLVDEAVENIDRALITAGGGGRGKWLEETLEILEAVAMDERGERPTKRQRREETTGFATLEPFGRPDIIPERQCPRFSGWTVDKFEDFMNSDGGQPRPVIFTDLIDDWPALTDCPWKSPEYLLSKTFGGRRLVPVEIGRSYVDDGWGQELIPFRTFLQQHVQRDTDDASAPTGYLAQHNLFNQIPSLRNDIRVPDFCWSTVPRHPTTPSLDQPPLDLPQLNAWFGPARTITPLHTDGYHNLLCQAVGAKYLRLYPPHASDAMEPRAPEHGVDMSNTSGLDVGVMEGWDEMPEGMTRQDVERMRQDVKDLECWECILEAGDTLVIPIGWWHYVRSLSVSFSVSFWWN